MRRLSYISVGLGSIIAIITLLFFFHFTVDDAYIVGRYAENLAMGNGLVFNIGEPVSALTSPLHALLATGLFIVTGSSVGVWKIVSLCLVIISLLALVRRLWKYPIALIIFVPITFTAAPIWMWSIGGLETGLLLFIVTMMGLVVDGLQKNPVRNFWLLCILAGTAVITRYDAVLFAAPVVIAAAWQVRDLKLILPAYIAGGLITLSWLVFAYTYYGDILPVSFYVKSPTADPIILFVNAFYIIIFLILIPVIPYLLLANVLRRAHRDVPKEYTASHWQDNIVWYGVILGLSLKLLYGLTMATTTHMMFSMRFFVPYIPLLAWLVSMYIVRFTNVLNQSSEQRNFLYFVLAIMWCLPIANSIYTYTTSLNGMNMGEYTDQGLGEYTLILTDTFDRQADIIAEHWENLEDTPDRLVRINTYVAGLLPYNLRDSYIIEALVSYRHADCGLPRETADYISVMASFLDTPIPDHFILLDEIIFPANRALDSSLYYNPSPLPNNMPPRITDDCLYDVYSEEPPPELLEN
ncbi:MAG: hypothetical protein AAFV98_07295 [Chloroflexota bacterium]